MLQKNAILLEMAVVVLVAACGTLEVGIERTATPTGTPTWTPTSTPTWTPTFTPSPLPPRAVTPTPVLTTVTATATFEVPPTDLCREYLKLSVLSGEIEEEAVATSYRCHSATIDATGRSPSRSPALVIQRGTSIHLELAVKQKPTAIDVRLYPDAGVSASFLMWPEELPIDVEAVDRVQPEPDTQFQVLPQALPGLYSLVIKVTWGEETAVFYAISFKLEDAAK